MSIVVHVMPCKPCPYVLVLLQASLHRRSKTILLGETQKQQQDLHANTQYIQVVTGKSGVCQIVYGLPC